MLKHFFVAAIVTSALSFLYGIYNISLEVEPNVCQMTYMFERPQFSRVLFNDNDNFPYYGLYYYNEGRTPMDVQKVNLKGAPVIFVPGNGGSYKQCKKLMKYIGTFPSSLVKRGLETNRFRPCAIFRLE